MELLGGIENRILEIRDQSKNGEAGEQEEDKITQEEINRAVKKLKLKNACGSDGIPLQAWKYAGSGIRKGFTMLL